MKVKLQPPSGTELVPFNPIKPPAAITQVMLLANPRKVGRLVFQILFLLLKDIVIFLIPGHVLYVSSLFSWTDVMGSKQTSILFKVRINKK